MRAARWLHFRHGLGAIAAAVIAATISIAAVSDSRAQNPPPDKRAQKKPPAKPAVRPPLRGAIKGPVIPNRSVVGPAMRAPIGRAPVLEWTTDTGKTAYIEDGFPVTCVTATDLNAAADKVPAVNHTRCKP